MYIWWSRLRWSILLYLDWFGTNCVMAKSSHAMSETLIHSWWGLIYQKISGFAAPKGDARPSEPAIQQPGQILWMRNGASLYMSVIIHESSTINEITVDKRRNLHIDVAARHASGASTASIRTTCLGRVGRWTRWRQRPSDTFSMFVHSSSFMWNNKDQKGSKKHGWQATKHLLLTQL